LPLILTIRPVFAQGIIEDSGTPKLWRNDLIFDWVSYSWKESSGLV